MTFVMAFVMAFVMTFVMTGATAFVMAVAMTGAKFEATMTDCSPATMAAFYRGKMAAFMGLDA
jgi:hypothetical protein